MQLVWQILSLGVAFGLLAVLAVRPGARKR
jgi:hypothetical protein